MIRRFGHWLVALLACAAMIGLHAYTGEFGHVDARRATIGQTARLYVLRRRVRGPHGRDLPGGERDGRHRWL